MAKVNNIQLNELIDQATSHVEDRVAGGKGITHADVPAHAMQAAKAIRPAAIEPYIPRLTSVLMEIVVEAIGMAAIQNREFVVAHVGEQTLKALDETIHVLRQTAEKLNAGGTPAPAQAPRPAPRAKAVAGDDEATPEL